MAKVKFVHVPYRGTAPALQGLLAGDVDVMFDNLGVSLALVKGGKLKLIAVGTERRMSALADVPTIAETLPGFASSAWFAVVAPPKTPARDRRQGQCRHRRGGARSRGAQAPRRICRPIRSAARCRRPPRSCAPRSSAGTT